MTTPLNDLNRYRYMVCKSSAKVKTDTDGSTPNNTTQTIIIIPFLDENVSHYINDIDITAKQTAALAPMGENSIGVFDCVLPYSTFFGISQTNSSKCKLLYATNSLIGGSTGNIPFFELSMNFAKKLKIIDYLEYDNGFYGKLKYMIQHFDKLLPSTEPYLIQPA